MRRAGKNKKTKEFDPAHPEDKRRWKKKGGGARIDYKT